MRRLDVRKEFPITKSDYPIFTGGEMVNSPIAYLDNAASTPMPRFLQNKFCDIFNIYYSNVHRGAHYFSQISTEKYEEARNTVMDFIGGNKKSHQVIFTYNTTDALNLAAHVIKDIPGIVLVSEMEHHSNYLPYTRSNIVKFFNVDGRGNIDYNEFEKKFKKYNVKLVAVSGASNVTGIIPDIAKLARITHDYGARILIDGAQMLAHTLVDLRNNKADFFVGAGHKMYAPGAAFLYGPADALNKAEAYRPGGNTINYVTCENTDYASSPARHEGGTPNIAGVIILGEAMKWLKRIGMDCIRNHESGLLKYLVQELKKIPGVEIYGDLNFDNHLGLLSFNIEGAHHSLAAAILNYEAGAAVRNGCHCAHIYLTKILGIAPKDIKKITRILSKKSEGKITEKENLMIPGTLRASLGIFNNREDIDKLIKGVNMIAEKKWQGKYKYKDGRYTISNIKMTM